MLLDAELVSLLQAAVQYSTVPLALWWKASLPGDQILVQYFVLFIDPDRLRILQANESQAGTVCRAVYATSSSVQER